MKWRYLILSAADKDNKADRAIKMYQIDAHNRCCAYAAYLAKICVIWLLSCQCIFACTGDCAMCHYKLDYKNDKRHSAMILCKNCHTDAKMAQINMGGCGKDCFECHEISKIQSPKLAKDHIVINACIQCHTQLNNSVLDTGINAFQKGIQSFSNQLLAH